MKCLILASGFGKRINEGFSDYKPKTLRKYLGKPILEHIIEHIDRVSSRIAQEDTRYGIAVNVAYEELFREVLGNDPRYTFIPGTETGTADTLYLCRAFVEGDEKFLVTNGDVIVGEKSLERIITSRPITLGAYPVNDVREGIDLLATHDLKLKGLEEYPNEMREGLFDAGVCLLDGRIFPAIPKTEINPLRGERKLIDSLIVLVSEGINVDISLIVDFYRHFTYKRDLDN